MEQVPGQPQGHHRCGLCGVVASDRQEERQDPDLGHRGAGAVPRRRHALLPRRCRGAHRVLDHRPPILRGCAAVALRVQRQYRAQRHRLHARRQQERPHQRAAGDGGGGTAFRRGEQAPLPRDLGKDGGERHGGVHRARYAGLQEALHGGHREDTGHEHRHSEGEHARSGPNFTGDRREQREVLP